MQWQNSGDKSRKVRRMTNREWLATLSTEDFAKWVCIPEEPVGNDWTNLAQPTPRFESLKHRYNSTYLGLKQWLDEERK